MVEKWIDALCDVWAEVESHKPGQKVRAFYVYKRDEFPESLAADLMPCVLTYVTGVESDLNAGVSLEHWRGVSEFHLFPNTDKRNYPAIMRYFARIRNAAALHMKLGGLVSYFLLRSNATRVTGTSLEGPVVMQYGSENPHQGLLVHWLVKEDVSTEVVIGS